MNSCATPRWVTGMPASAGAAIELVTPGTTVTGTPAAAQASSLLAAAAEHVRVAALEPDHELPGRGPLDQDPVDLLLGAAGP